MLHIQPEANKVKGVVIGRNEELVVILLGRVPRSGGLNEPFLSGATTSLYLIEVHLRN